MKTFICKHCGAEIKRKRVRNAPKFCSDKCRRAAELDELVAMEDADWAEQMREMEAVRLDEEQILKICAGNSVLGSSPSASA